MDFGKMATPAYAAITERMAQKAKKHRRVFVSMSISEGVQPTQQAEEGRQDPPFLTRPCSSSAAYEAKHEDQRRGHLHTFGAVLMGLRAGFLTEHTLVVRSTITGTSTILTTSRITSTSRTTSTDSYKITVEG